MEHLRSVEYRQGTTDVECTKSHSYQIKPEAWLRKLGPYKRAYIAVPPQSTSCPNAPDELHSTLWIAAATNGIVAMAAMHKPQSTSWTTWKRIDLISTDTFPPREGVIISFNI